MTRLSCSLLKLLLILIFAGWVSLWVLKPTDFWTRKWKKAEEKASASVFGYNGLNFVVFTFPIIALAIIGSIYLELKQRQPRNRQKRSSFTSFSNPLFVNKYVGILSGLQILASSLFIILLGWTFYARISNDFKKMTPIKSFKLTLYKVIIPQGKFVSLGQTSGWQYKLFRMATRCGLLAEVCLALLLLPVLRGLSVFRLLGVQFEVSVRYHIWLGTSMIFFATLHGAGTFFIWGIKHRIQDEMWKWQNKGRIYLAGEMALFTALVIFITALPQIRRKWFQLFYYTHHLYIVFLILFLFHGGDRHFYTVFPGVFLFALDKMLRIIQSRPETCILSARVFPCKAMELTLPKDPKMKFMPTSVVFLKIPCVSKFEWHPFSITSSSSVDEDTMAVIVKSEGQWTGELYNKIHGDGLDSEADQRMCIPVAVEGPYGPASLDFLRYDNLLLVAGGIGITPFLSIMQEISSNSTKATIGYPNRIQLIYITKKSQDLSLLDPILPQLLNIKQFHIKLKVYVTQENQIGITLREVLNNIPETRITNFSTKSASYAAYGSERLLCIGAIALVSSIKFLVSLVCFNHFFIPPSKKPSEIKNPSSQIDFLLMCSFVTAIIVSSLMAVMIRWRRIKKELQLSSNKKIKYLKRSSFEATTDIEEHEIHFGGRPKFQDIFYSYMNECGGSETGVFVCGPEAMKESVASECRLSLLSQKNAKGKRSHISFHSLNFSL